MNILSIEEIGSVSDKDAKESERLKREVYQDCVDQMEDHLSSEQLKQFEHAFNEVAAKYLFRESK